MCGEGKKSEGRGLPGGSGAGARPRRTAAQVSENRVANSLLPFLPGSLWQPRSQVSWEAPGLAARTLGGEGCRCPVLPQFPRLGTPLEALSLWLAFGEGTEGCG